MKSKNIKALSVKKETIANLAPNEMNKLPAGLQVGCDKTTRTSMCPHETCSQVNNVFMAF
ncbi:MAG: hypothetical protein GY765_11470 [bacterium]|nr:hypothetical protein [bacterium]